MSKNRNTPVPGTEIESGAVSVSDSVPTENMPIEETPVLKAIPQIQGIKTGISQIEAELSRYEESVRKMINFGESADDLIAEIKKDSNTASFKAMALLNPDWEETIRLKGKSTLQKAVALSNKQILIHIATIRDLSADLNKLYGEIAGNVSVSEIKGDIPAGANITKEVFDNIPDEKKSALNLVFIPISGADVGLVTGTGHKKGTYYKSNIDKW